jgi:transmembrane sensor
MSIHISRMDGKPPSSDVMADAERWYARLRAPDCTASERLEFKRWQVSPEHAAAYAATERLWQSVGKLAGRPDLEQLSRQILADTAPRSLAVARRRLVIAASVAVASLIALVSGGVILRSQYSDKPTVVYATKPGERSIIKLADGSQLVLNYATDLDVRLGKDTRRLTLRRGEALFTVAHDATRPFKVDAGGGEVTALGTRFEVRSDAGHVTVTLLEGRVAVDRFGAKEHVELQPGDQVRFTEATPKMMRRIVDPEVVSSWSTGRLRFRATPLPEALDEVNRYSSTQIRIADPTLTSIPISGTFEIGDTASVVSALEALLPIQAAEKDGEVLLRRRN